MSDNDDNSGAAIFCWFLACLAAELAAFVWWWL